MTRLMTVQRRATVSSAVAADGAGVTAVGPNNPTAVTNDATVGTFTWSNPTRAETQDGQTANAGPMTALTGISEYLLCGGFGFALGAVTVHGVLAEAFAWGDGTIGDVRDNSIKLALAGVPSGIDLSAGGFTIATGAVVTYKRWGGPLSLWGLGLTPTDVNDANFGVALSFKNTSVNTRSALVDHVRMTVYYV